MEHGIGGPTECNDHGDGIFKSLTGHDIAWFDILFDQVDHRSTGILGINFLIIGYGELCGTVWQAHTKCFDGGGHGIGGVHSTTGSWAGNCLLFDIGEFLLINLAGCMGTDCFENRYNIEILSL